LQVEIGTNTAVSSAIIDNATKIKHSCILETGTVIGPRVIIGEEVTVNSLVRIWPEVRVKNGTKVSENLGNEDFGNDIKGS
jgi:mannose-1-phosphate guanylyltransferase